MPASRARKLAAATTIAALLAAPRVVELGEVGGQGRVIELLAGEPGVELAERAGVGAAGVVAQRGVDQAARGRARRADRGLSRGDLGE